MAQYATVTGVTNAPSALIPAVASRRNNLLSIQVLNTGSGDVVVDIYDGASLLDSVACPANSESTKEWAPANAGAIGRLGSVNTAINVQTRAAASGVEVQAEFGRV